jgi:hypothetical protein
VWCREAEENCNVAKCTYSMCFKRRMLPGAVCGETVKRKTVDRDIIDEEPVDDNKNAAMHLKGKARRFGNQDDYY